MLSHAGCLRAEMLEWARVTRQLLGGDSGFVPTEAAGHRNFLLEGLCCLKQRSSGRRGKPTSVTVLPLSWTSGNRV